jgi:type VI secretion system secreted protein VgrG
VASFDVFLPMLLGFEGGYVDDPTDPGGETNKGITMSTFQLCSHELLGIDPTSQNLRSRLTLRLESSTATCTGTR